MVIEKKNKLLLFPRLGKYIIIFFALAFIAVGVRGYQLFRYVFQENVKTDYILLIPEDAEFNQVVDSMQQHDVLKDYKAFQWVAKKKAYKTAIKSGRFLLKEGMNTNELVNMLRIGQQKPVKVTFNNIRFKEELAGAVSKYIREDSITILQHLRDTALIVELGFEPETFKAIFIPNTYEFYWTSTSLDFINRMLEEYNRFWNEGRLEKAKKLKMTPIEIITLASIVQEETIKNDEKPIVAGLYINRLKKGIALQADPTLKFALGDFSIRRVLNRHLEIDSPYNTYLHAGLPPGPINFPEISSIDAVLNYEPSNYLYMCAKEDFSGYHNFAGTLSEHNRNAEKYRLALDENNIYK